MRYVTIRNILLSLTLYSAISWAGTPTVTTFQTRILKPNGAALESSSVNFRFTILDSAGTCTLFVEDYAGVNMSGSQGIVAFTLGTGSKQFPAGVVSMYEVFNNSTPSFPCQAGGSYTPGTSDRRQIVMQFNDGSGWQTLPQMAINSVFYANYANRAEALGSYPANDYLRPATLPTCSGSQALTFNGTSFVCVTASGGGGGGITSVTANAPLVVSGGTSTPVVSIPVASGSASGYLSSADWTTFNNKASATLASGKLYLGNSSNAATGVTLSGDATLANTGVMTLANSGVTAGTYGSASAVPTFTVDAKGRVTNVTTNAYQDATNIAKGVVQVGSNITLNAGVISISSSDVTNALGFTPANSNAFIVNGAATWNGTSTPPSLSGTGQGRIYFDSISNKFKVSQNGDAYVDLVGAGSGLSGTGTPGKIVKYSSASVLADSVITESSGNVGIGTNAPGYRLDSVGGFFHAGVNSQAIPPSDNANGGLIVGWNRLSGGGFGEVNLYNAYDSGGVGSFLFSQKTGASTANDLMSILRNGNVGIGTTTPSYRLDVVGDVNVSGTFRVNGAAISSGAVSSVSSANTDIGVATGSTTPVLTLNSGVGANQIVKLTAAGYYPAVNGSLITNLNLANVGTSTLAIANGGTNSSTALNNNRIMISSGGAIVEAPALTNGQILIGSTGAAPAASTLTAGNGITITNGGGAITPAVDAGLGINKIPQVGGVALAANSLLMANGTGTALIGMTCSISEILQWNGTSWNCVTVPSSVWTSNSGTIYYNSGNVGIGTTAPNSPLEITTGNALSGSTNLPRIRVNSSTNGGTVGAGLAFAVDGNGSANGNVTAKIVGIRQGNNGLGDLAFFTNTSGASSGDATVERMRIDKDGNVGIGTSTPVNKLQVIGTIGVGTSTGQITMSGDNSVVMGIGTSISATAKVNSVVVGYGNTLGAGMGASSAVVLGSSNTVGYNNSVAIGRSNSTNQADTAVALGIGNSTSADGGVAIGYGNTTSAGSAIAIGKNISNSVANTLQIGPSDANKMTINASGNLGIGTTTPAEKLTVAGNISLPTSNSKITGSTGLVLEETGDTYGTVRLNLQNRSGVNGAMFEQAGSVDLVDFVFKGLTNQRNIRYESRGGSYNLIGTPEFQIGVATDPNLVISDSGSAVLKGNFGVGTASIGSYKMNVAGDVNITGTYRVNGVAIGSGSSQWTGSSDIYYNGGKVGIGTSTPSQQLEVVGTIKATDLILSSDRNLKKDIQPLQNSLQKLLQLQGVSYKWRCEDYPDRHFDQEEHLGFVAQEVEKIFPNLVHGKEGSKAVEYTGLIAPIVEAIKSQNDEIERLKTINAQQQELLQNLMKRVEALEKK